MSILIKYCEGRMFWLWVGDDFLIFLKLDSVNKIVTLVEKGNPNRKLLFPWVAWGVSAMETLKTT